MVIKDKRSVSKVEFKDVSVGDAFAFDDELFIKIYNSYGCQNAFCLHQNAKFSPSQCFDKETLVQKVELEVIIHEDGWEMDYLENEYLRKE